MTATEWLYDQLVLSDKTHYTATDLDLILEQAKRQEDEFAIGFAKWIDMNYFVYNTFEKSVSTEEMLKIYKEL